MENFSIGPQLIFICDFANALSILVMVVLYANILGGLQSNSCNILYLHIEKNIFAGYVEHSIKRRKNLFFCQPEHLLLLQGYSFSMFQVNSINHSRSKSMQAYKFFLGLQFAYLFVQWYTRKIIFYISTSHHVI